MPKLSMIATAAMLCNASMVEAKEPTTPAPVSLCKIAGPQAPRDITQKAGANGIVFGMAPPATNMRLCDIHFHKFAEHKGPGYSTLAGSGDNKGYVCNGSNPAATAP